MNERLQEISDFVDDYFDNKKANIILTEKEVECEQKNELIRKFDTDKMNNIEKLFKIDNNDQLLWFIKKSKYYFYEIIVLKEKTQSLCNNLKEQVNNSNVNNKQKNIDHWYFL